MAREHYHAPSHIRAIGIASLAFGILGAAFFWWTPLGMVFSLTGVVIGFAGWLNSRRGLAALPMPLAGMLISAAALILNFVIAGLGLEIIKFQALR